MIANPEFERSKSETCPEADIRMREENFGGTSDCGARHGASDPGGLFGLRRSLTRVGLFLLLSSLLAPAQPLTPHIGYVYPAGGRQGTTFQVKVGGQFLDGASNVLVSGTGIEAKVLQHTKPMTQKQFNDLRDRLKELQDKRMAAMRSARRGKKSQGSTNVVWTAADDQAVAELRKKIASFVRRPMNPAIAETVTLQVTISPDVLSGEQDLRIVTAQGLSNPLVFCVGQFPEFTKREVKDTDDLQTAFRKFRNPNEQGAAPPTETKMSIPGTANGQVMAGGVDRFRFSAHQGQHLVISARARELIPYLADAVPGWFQATLALYDAKGKELAYDDDFRFNPDPVLYFEVPKDGEYLVEIKDSIYRGREDFVYRIEISEAPFITGIFPLGGKLATTTDVQLAGWNLPCKGLSLALPGEEVAKQGSSLSLCVTNDGQLSNFVPFALDTLPELLEVEPNDTKEAAQAVTHPLNINGRIDKPGDIDVFSFTATAGQEIVADVMARKLNSPLDSILKLTDAGGKQLALNDDCEDKGCGLTTHHADSRIAFKVPADGTYFLSIADAQRHGGPEYAYRLRLSQPRPNFELRVAPSSMSVRSGTCVPITVYALRQDGFSNQITIALADAPPGFALSGAVIPAGQDQVRLTLSAPASSSSRPTTLTMEGHAIINGKAVTRQAVPAEDMMQAFAYHHLVPSKELKVSVNGRSFGRSTPRLLTDERVAIPAGGSARVRVAAPALAFSDRIQLELSDPPEGISIDKVSASRDGTEIVFQCDSKAKPGLKGNLIVNALAKPPAAGKGKAKTAANTQRRFPIGTLPAIPFEIVAR